MKHVSDQSGLYNLNLVAMVQPIVKHDEKADPSKITAVHARIVTAGGTTHDTNMPYEIVGTAAVSVWNGTDNAPSPEPLKPEDSEPAIVSPRVAQSPVPTSF